MLVILRISTLILLNLKLANDSENKLRLRCSYCRKIGHIKDECRKMVKQKLVKKSLVQKVRKSQVT